MNRGDVPGTWIAKKEREGSEKKNLELHCNVHVHTVPQASSPIIDIVEGRRNGLLVEQDGFHIREGKAKCEQCHHQPRHRHGSLPDWNLVRPGTPVWEQGRGEEMRTNRKTPSYT